MIRIYLSYYIITVAKDHNVTKVGVNKKFFAMLRIGAYLISWYPRYQDIIFVSFIKQDKTSSKSIKEIKLWNHD